MKFPLNTEFFYLDIYLGTYYKKIAIVNKENIKFLIRSIFFQKSGYGFQSIVSFYKNCVIRYSFVSPDLGQIPPR